MEKKSLSIACFVSGGESNISNIWSLPLRNAQPTGQTTCKQDGIMPCVKDNEKANPQQVRVLTKCLKPSLWSQKAVCLPQ